MRNSGTAPGDARRRVRAGTPKGSTRWRTYSALHRGRGPQTGASERTVQREAARSEAVPNVSELAGTSLDSAKELDALARLPPEQQQAVIARAMPGEKVSAAHEVKKVRRADRERDLATRSRGEEVRA
jgi:DNA-directed RNA polymerase specialized sigma24 family protein